MSNPFPGLRPFEPDEDHLFFGREKETDDLLRRLRSNRFLSVVGTSGSGKSSLVRSGLIPSLQSGFMVSAGSSWRISIMRPGEDPIGHLADALDTPEVIGALNEELAATNRVLLDATLRRGRLGLVDAVRLARIPRHDNLLILVDQFEELFRFRRSRQIENSRDEAVAFVKLLLEAANQTEMPIYIVLTMRSDFIGDCMDYPGLPEAVNESQYLVPRMTRDELRSAITGPVAVAGGGIAPRLVLRLLNDVGDDQDQLPLMQHVLMRSWDHWAQHRQAGQPIDLANYEAVGTLQNALSIHAEEAYAETGTDERKRITERILKALTDTYSDPRGVRRPTSVADLAAICEVAEATVADIVEIFRRPGRSFLMPPSSAPLTSRVIVDLSHESLMRCWKRLIEWAQGERESATQYVRTSLEASYYQRSAAGLWDDPELELALQWRRRNHPTAAWARRLDQSFDLAMDFLDRSAKERDRLKAERRAWRRRNFYLLSGTAVVFVVAFVIAALAWLYARGQQTRAEGYLGLAKKAVDDTLVAADRDPTRMGAEVPQLNEFRRELLDRVKRFYVEFIKQQPNNAQLLNEMALAHLRLGHINRMVDDRPEAAREYEQAIAQFDSLSRSNAGHPEYRQALASAYTWLGETMRPLRERYADAEKAYGNALRVQMELVNAYPGNATYRQELARTRYDRGILSWSGAAPGEPRFDQAEADFRDAVRLLEPIAGNTADVQISQDLARAYNNLANLLWQQGMPEAKGLFEKAILIHEALTARDPRNREYKLELATFSENLSWLLRDAGDANAAARPNARALALLDELVRPAPSLGIEQADAHTLRARILQSRGSRDASAEYRRSLERFEDLAKAQIVSVRADFYMRLGDLLLNLASLRREQPQNDDARRVLTEAVGLFVGLWRQAAAAGLGPDAQAAVDNVTPAMSALPDSDRRALIATYPDLRQILNDNASNRRP